MVVAVSLRGAEPAERVIVFGIEQRTVVSPGGPTPRFDAEAYSHDISAAVAHAAHLKYRIVEKTNWTELLKAFQAGEVDVLVAVARLPEREASMLFSVPHLHSSIGIFARRGGPQASTLDDLKGRRVAAVREGVGNHFLRRQGLTDQIVLGAGAAEVMQDLVDGRAEFAVQNQLAGVSTIHSRGLKDKVYLALALTESGTDYCLAVRPNDTWLLARLNDGLFVLQERRVLAELYEKWFSDVKEISVSKERLTRWSMRAAGIGLLAGLLAWAWHRVRLRRERQRSTEIERLVAERTRELSESRARYQTLFEESALPLWEHDMREVKSWIDDLHGRGIEDLPARVQANPDEFRQVLARTRVLDVNRACVEYYEADDRDALREHLKAAVVEDGGLALAEGLQALKRGARQCSMEKPTRTMRGAKRHIAKIMNFMPGGEAGLSRVLFSAMDITARVEAEQRLRESAELNHLVLTATNDGVWDWDLAAGRIAFNARWHEMLGHQPGELPTESDSWEKNIHPENLTEFRDLLSRHQESGSPFSCTARWRHKDGNYRWIISRAQAVRDGEGRPVRIVAGHADVSELRRMDDELVQSRKLRALGEMVGGIAHEFNNLLSPMLLQTEVICQDRASDHELHQQLRLILASVQEAKELTQRILMFGRRTEIRRDIVELAGVLQDNLELVHRTTDRRIAITLHVDGVIPPLWLNRSDLNQVVLNLVLNARDTLMEKLVASSGDEWSPTIRLELARVHRASSAPGVQLPTAPLPWQRVSVRDNGMGLPAAHRERIFEPFFTTKEHGVGTGLGLATVWHLMLGMGGWVEVESEPGAGTTFHVFIPETPVPGELLKPRVRPSSNAAGANATKAAPAEILGVLLVEDNDMISRVTQKVLARLGCSVTPLADGRVAWDRLRQGINDFDLVITDLNMPGMSGIDFLHAARAAGYTGRIIVISGLLTDDVQAKLAGAKVDVFLKKPFELDHLRAALERCRG